jgi:ATP-dependent Lon protease
VSKPILPIETIEIPATLPIVPLRDVVIFPYMIFPLMIGRSSSMRAVEEAMVKDKLLFVIAQRDPVEDEPKRRGLYEVGTVVKVLQILKLPNNVIKVLVEGVTRAKMQSLRRKDGFRRAEIEPITVDVTNMTPEMEAHSRVAVGLFRKYVTLNPNLPDELVSSLDQIPAPDVLIDFLASHVTQSVEAKQPVLEAITLDERLQAISFLLEGENEILELERNIENQVRDKISRHQRSYFLQEQLRIIREELGENAEDDEGVVSGYREKLEEVKLPKEAAERVDEELAKLAQMSPMSPEANVIRNYLDWIVALPWSKSTRDRLDLTRAGEILDEDHYGLVKPKERVLEHLAVLKLVRKIRGQIICFSGPPGTGKTSLGRSIARALGREFVRVSLGGVRDEAEIRGHRRTYIGALPGRIIQSLKKAGSRNPVILLDEIDKMAMDFRGDPASALLEVLDPQQNHTFNDHYLDLDFDLSQVMFLTTANVEGNIPHALHDRMEIIRLPGYLLHEKLQIAKNFLLPRQLKEHGLTPEMLKLSDSALEGIVTQYTMEAGVRTLERKIAAVCRKVTRNLVKANPKLGTKAGKKSDVKMLRVGPPQLQTYLGVPGAPEKQAPESPMLGRAIGLAWTPVGGDLLYIEVGVHPGKGRLQLTGKLGEVMQESGRTALTWLKMNAKTWKIAPTWFDKHDVHIHVPEGAIPKDGPSAGITLVTSMVSAITGRKVSNEIAMTGEVTLHGEVLPIGGLNEKAMAALRAGLTQVVIPKGNIKDLQDMHRAIRDRMTFIPVEHVSEVLKLVLLSRRGGTTAKKVAAKKPAAKKPAAKRKSTRS